MADKPQILVLVTSDQMVDVDDTPDYENGTTSFYWGAFPDSPLPNRRVWCLLDSPTTEEEAHKLLREYLGEDEDEDEDED